MNEAQDRPGWAPEEVDLARPSAARVYDFYLGGSHNFAVDRELAQKALEAMPTLPQAAAANRSFLRRVTRYLLDQGITQFLDIGSGIPTVGNTHEIVQSTNDDGRVVYVDIDPVAVVHSQAMLDGNDRAAIVAADLRKPAELLAEVKRSGLLDLDKPVAAMLISVLPFLSADDEPYGVLREIRDALAPGSYVAISQATMDSQPEIGVVANFYKNSPNPVTLRKRDEIVAFFDGLSLVEPGVVFVPEWRPDSVDPLRERPEQAANYGALGRKD